MRQITKEEAIAIFQSKLYEDWTDRERAEFQINQLKLAMPFDVFHQSVENCLGRPVFTHEMISDEIKMELMGDKEAPSIDEIIAMIPKDKLVIINH